MNKELKRFIASAMSVVMLTTSLIIPTGQAFARADPSVYQSSATIGQFKPDSTCIAQGGTAGCGYYERFGDLEGAGLTRVTVPRDNWRLIAQISGTGRTDSGNFMIQGEGWITYGVEGVGRLGLEPNQVAMILNRDENGNPTANARIKCFRTSDNSLQSAVLSDANGAYSAFTPYYEAHYLVVQLQTTPLKAGASIDTIFPG